jgi:methyl-accepting chemotaxis protein
VRTAVEDAARVSESGVLEVGKALGALISESRTQTNDLMQVLPHLEGSGEASGIRDAIERQTSVVQAFVTALMERADRQNQLAEHASKLTEGIASLARDVGGIAIKARLLSLNARIECGRLGESGKAMTVVASEIRQVSSSVAKANADIVELASQLNELLPKVARSSAELHNTSDEFRGDFEASLSATQESYGELIGVVKSTVERSQTRSERMLEEAQQALSALNFQDPMVQQLRELAALVEQRATGQLGGNLRIGTQLSSTAGFSDPLPIASARAGEVDLF